MKYQQQAIEKLKEYDVHPSIQRVMILDYLLSCNVHPTVDDIYSALLKDIPTLSRATVYNTVNKLVEVGLVRQLKDIDKTEARYDACLETHGHFKCVKCGKIFDFKVCDKLILDKKLEGFTVNTKTVYFQGVCPECNKVNS